MSRDVLVTPTTEPVIGSDGEVAFPPGMGWETIANELAAEVTRLHNEIDRLKGGPSQQPLESKADWTHPLYREWVELRLDSLPTLQYAWEKVAAIHGGPGSCPKCDEPLTEGPYPPFRQCLDDGLCFIAGNGTFALDTIERAQERGPDA